ncbi:MAG: hypothetical protein HC890_01295 [Chloroflexaceae bacterium]|nr:hypothetical protein [Chloroflexaceae bacterium]
MNQHSNTLGILTSTALLFLALPHGLGTAEPILSSTEATFEAFEENPLKLAKTLPSNQIASGAIAVSDEAASEAIPEEATEFKTLDGTRPAGPNPWRRPCAQPRNFN